MKTLSSWLGLAMVACLLLVIGCGGGDGGSTGSSPNAQSRSRTLRTLSESQMALIQSGFQTSGQAFAINGGTTGGTGGTSGGGYGVPIVGAYIRNQGGGTTGSSMGGHPLVAGTGSTGGSTTSGGGGGEPNFYYDEYLGLWSYSTWTDTTWDSELYVDQAKTQPAGSFHSTYSDWTTFPVLGTSTYSITDGPFKGAHGQYETVYESDSKGHLSYDNFWPGYGTDKGSSSWSENGWVWNYKNAQPDGSWSQSNGSFNSEREGTAVSENSLGYKWTYRYHSDGSGDGVIEGPDPGLPAKVSWTANGHFRVEWADGTVDEWDMWEVFDGGGATEGGTSGGSSGGTTGNG